MSPGDAVLNTGKTSLFGICEPAYSFGETTHRSSSDLQPRFANLAALRYGEVQMKSANHEYWICLNASMYEICLFCLSNSRNQVA